MMNKKNVKMMGLLLASVLMFKAISAQTKQVTNSDKTWISVNSVIKFSPKWGLLLDVHERRNNYFADNDFHFVRTGVWYQADKNLSFAAGVANLWLASKKNGVENFAKEDRIYQQVQLTSSYKKINMLQRLRSEQRWREALVNNQHVDSSYFSQRFRYLLSTTIPIFKDKKLPQLVVSNELLFQFGEAIKYNVFDQNRLFIGFKQTLTKSLSCDFGYMNVYQQGNNGLSYANQNTYRLFFYYTPKLYKEKK